MITHKCIEIYTNIVFFSPSLINDKSIYLSSQHFFWNIDWMFYFVFVTKKANANIILFCNVSSVSSFCCKFHVFKIKSFRKIVVSFCHSCWMMIFKCLTKHHLNHSLASVFWILIKLFLGWSNSIGNLI